MSCQAIQLRKTSQEAMIRVVGRSGPARCLLWGTRLVSYWWNLPPTRSNWHDTPPKKGVPYAVLFGRDPIYVYDDDDHHHHQAVPSPYECPFHQLPLPHHVSKQGWAYVKCPAQPCAVFFDEKAAPSFLDQLRQQKHPQLIAGQGTADDPQPPLMCFLMNLWPCVFPGPPITLDVCF